MLEQRIRFLLSRDDYYHQRGYWVLASALRDAGLEVILGGIQTPEEIVQTAIQENVDIIGYRIMNAAPKILLAILFDIMKAEKILDIPVVVGGIIPQSDEAHEAGYASEHDALIGKKLGYILCGGDLSSAQWVDEQHILDLEREAFVALLHEPKTLERMWHMLQHNRPLRN